MKCQICGNPNSNQTFTVREMFYGTRETFTYMECQRCGCLQLLTIPEDMAKYYPSTYHTPNTQATTKEKIKNKALTITFRTQLTLNRKIIKLNWFPASIFRDLPPKTHLTTKSKILEVGCGSGKLLELFQDIGFRNVLGIDPYVADDNKSNVEIQRGPIDTIQEEGQFDLIIFDHSFEHIPTEPETLSQANRLLSQTGTCLIRIPVKTEFIWKKYGTNWAQIDAPRHFYLHTKKSFEILAEQCGFKIDRVVFDSNEFQFWASEQYLADIHLRAKNSYWINKERSIVKDKIEEYRAWALKLNQEGQGDQAAFYLTKQ